MTTTTTTMVPYRGLPADRKDRAVAVLMQTGNASSAARALGVSRMTLYRWRKDPDFAASWDAAIAAKRENLVQAVLETAEAMGLGRWVPDVDELGDPVLDEDLEPAMRFDTSGVEPRVLLKLMDKTMEAPAQRVDQRTLLAGRLEHEHPGGRHGPRLLLVGADGAERPLLPSPPEDDDHEDEED